MEQELKCSLLLTLKKMSLRAVVALSLSSGSDAFARFPDPYLATSNSPHWIECSGNIVKDRLSQLKLPLTLLEQAKDLVRPMVLEIRRWMVSCDNVCGPMVDKRLLCSTQLCWTSVGTIDDRKTAENFVRRSLIDVDMRYRVACAYCLEESIPRLWMELPERRKAYYLGRDVAYDRLESLWARNLSDQPSSLNHLRKDCSRFPSFINQWRYEYAAKRGHKAATKYFYEKLTFAEREATLMRTADELLKYRVYMTKSFEVIHYLLTMMTPEERRKTVEKHPIHVLLLFLRWPLQELFVENANLVWTFLPPYAYGYLLREMSDEFIMLRHYCPETFREFFIQSPPELRKRFANEFYNGTIPAKHFLALFVESKDSESIRVVFRNVGKEERLKIVLDYRVNVLCWVSIEEGRWQMVELCLREATLSEEHKRRWEEGFRSTCGPFIRRWDPIWRGFLEYFEGHGEKESGRKRKFAELLNGGSSE